MGRNVRRNGLRILGVTVVELVVIFAATRLIEPPALANFVAGGAVAVSLCGVAWIMVTTSGRAVSQLLGADAEGFTAGEVGSRRRRRAGWRIVHNLHVDRCEVDHVAIGPAGILAIETKWAGGEPWRVVGDRLVGAIGDPIVQAQRSARKVRSFLTGSTCGPPITVPVRPVLVVWGPGTPVLADDRSSVNGVLVVAGREPAHRASLLDGPQALDAELQRAVAQKVQRFAEWVRPRPAAPRRPRAAAASTGGSRR